MLAAPWNSQKGIKSPYLGEFGALLLILSQVGCATFPTGTQSPGRDHEKLLEQQQQLELLVKDHAISKQHIAGLNSDVRSLFEQVSTLKRQLEVVRRGMRSGVFEEFADTGKFDVAHEKGPALPDLSFGRVQVSSVDSVRTQDEGLKLLPEQLLADAELKMQRAQFGEAVVILTEIEKSAPNMRDEGRSLLLLAECWNKLGQFDNAQVVLRSFYLNHPTSPHVLKGKYLEALSNEGRGLKGRAVVLYREVVAGGPQTSLAQSAREAMQRLRDAK